jgi:hypothetical protein
MLCLVSLTSLLGLLRFEVGVAKEKLAENGPSMTSSSQVEHVQRALQGDQAPAVHMTAPAQQGHLFALNVLDGKLYPHHPVMLQVPTQACNMEGMACRNQWFENSCKV